MDESRSRRRFTIIELLVIVAVVAIVFVILTPMILVRRGPIRLPMRPRAIRGFVECRLTPTVR